MTPKKYFDNHSNPVDPNYVFALIPEESKTIYTSYIKKVSEELDLRCESYLDISISRPGDPQEHVWERIQKADIIIADITSYNPNVMYELGVALSLKDADDVLILCGKASAPSLPFSVRSFRVALYSENTLKELRKNLKGILQDIKRNKRRFTENPISNLEARELMKRAKEQIEDQDWMIATLLIEKMDLLEPENWYILNQWGRMHRGKQDYETADSKFQEALRHTTLDEEKAEIYIELAILHQKTRKIDDAEVWFKKAERANKKNKALYFAWAGLYEEQKDYLKALNKISFIRQAIDPEDEEAITRFKFYSEKVNNPASKLTYADFKKQQERRQSPVTIRPSSPETPQQLARGSADLPWDISWKDFSEGEFEGEIVNGTVRNISPNLGVFVDLTRNYTGYIHKRRLPVTFEDDFAINQRIKVLINNISINPKTGKERIDLTYVSDE
ncbi:MAG: hypothetical protein GY862_04880 [Gammaproteobacteria bacterium]|nr:hypothetical protein [Gammaproteobacteria bacterium]